MPYPATLREMKNTTDQTSTPCSANQGSGVHALLTQEELTQFQQIAQREYGVRLTDTQAYEQATALLTLFETLLKKGLAFGRQNDMMTSA